MSSVVGLTPAARFVRGWLCASLATFLAAASHAVAGGSIPAIATLIALALSGLICVVLAGRRLSVGLVALGVGISQTAFHTLFGVFSSLPGGTAHNSAGPEQMLIEHDHTGMSVLTSTSSASSAITSIDAMAGMGGAGPRMLVSHVVAGVLAVALIRYGEGLWWSLVAILSASIAMIVVLIRVYPVVEVGRTPVTAHQAHGLYELLHCDTRLRLRGPPLEPIVA